MNSEKVHGKWDRFKNGERATKRIRALINYNNSFL